MNKVDNNNVHWTFWTIVLLGLLWNGGGIYNYMIQMNPEFVASMSSTHQAIIEARPAWATGGFAIGVFGGTLGCFLLLLKKQIAGLVFMFSLMGIFVTMIHALNVVVSSGNISVSAVFQIVILPIVVANFLIGFTFYAAKQRWIS